MSRQGLDTATIFDYAHTMSEFNDHETSIYGSFGEFEPQTMTDEEWAEYDAWVAAEIEAAEEMSDSLEYWPSPEDFHAPF